MRKSCSIASQGNDDIPVKLFNVLYDGEALVSIILNIKIIENEIFTDLRTPTRGTPRFPDGPYYRNIEESASHH